MPAGETMHCRRARSVLQPFLLITVVFTILYLLNNSQPSIHTIVTETHRQLNSLKNINIKDSLRPPDVRLKVDPRYLERLGFVSVPRLYPEQVWTNVTLPVLVTAAWSGQGELVTGLVLSARRHQPQLTLLVQDLGLGGYERQRLEATCNSTACRVLQLDFSGLPSHLDEAKTGAVVPVLIQEVLDRAGAVLYLDAHSRLLPHHNISSLVARARQLGVLAWPLQLPDQPPAAPLPTTAFTHFKMFSYFAASLEQFYFHRMISDKALILFNTAAVHQRLMLPWLQCALLPDCVAPTGAQTGGCRFNKKPHYRYSGCHGYDTSALSVVLGLMFKPEVQPYLVTEKFFTVDPPDDDDGLLNATSTTAAP